MPKIIEKIREKQETGEKFFSLEFFPPRTELAANNLFSLFDRFSEGQPLFIDVTWGAGGGNPSSEDVATSSLSVASAAVNYCGQTTMLHLTCTYMTRDECRAVLNRAKELGICNILALRGDRPEDGSWIAPENGFTYCSDLVRFIREEYGNYFGICVAGYPNGHPDSPDLDSDIFYLKEKVDAGADFIITQLFFDSQVYFEFYEKCRKIGIECPIIPGILPIQGYASLRHLMKLSKIKPPGPVINRIEEMKDNDQAIRDYGVEVAINMCKELMESNIELPGFHFYTLNREVAVINILKAINMWQEHGRKELPWALISANDRRSNELVRPIFWACRPKSYLIRTRDWNDFPNGRWGDSSSPAFGDLKGYYLFKDPELHTKQSLREMWGTPQTVNEIHKVFVQFLSGGENNRVNKLPWSEGSQVASETSVISTKLIWLNENGILTTNSQPAVNGKLSTDPVFGWGPEGGYIYQKAYLEFFIDPTLFSTLISVLNDKTKYPSIQYHAVNMKGDEVTHPCSNRRTPTAVTWGVFPGSEILQPTVVDPESFLIWKDEAFGLWKSEWGSIYEKDSISYRLIQEIYDTYWLVNIVDNDFINGDIFKPFSEILPQAMITPH